jgi:taurine-pyruvate aminotransferase
MPTAYQRASVFRKDLDNVIHPLVPHRQLEQQQLVIVSAKDSTVVDADGREYLDGMAVLW